VAPETPSNKRVMRLFLIRHGAVQPPRPGMFYGGSEVPLSDLGQQEARRAGDAMRHRALDRLWASPLSRARFGAECVLEGREGLDIQFQDGFREIARGRWVGLTAEEIDTQFPEDRESHRRDPKNWRDHGGESLGDFRTRVLGSWEPLERECLEHEQATGLSLKVCLVSHLFPTRAILAHYQGVELEGWDQFAIPTASISELEIHGPGQAELVRVGWKPEATA